MNDLVLAAKAADWHKLRAQGARQRLLADYAPVYNMALDEFMVWFRLEPRPGLQQSDRQRLARVLESRKLGSSIIIRMSSIRKLAREAFNNGLLAPELAAGISCVKSVKSIGSA